MRMVTGKEERTIADKISDPNRPTWEQFKKENADKLDLDGNGEKEMKEYRKKLDAAREKVLLPTPDKRNLSAGELLIIIHRPCHKEPNRTRRRSEVTTLHHRRRVTPTATRTAKSRRAKAARKSMLCFDNPYITNQK